MVGNNANADVLTLRYCLSHAVECLNILSEHLTWDRGPRRLHLRRIKDRNGDVLSKSDHINIESWEGNVNVRNVTLVTTWNLERQQVTSEFPESGIEDTLLDLKSNAYDMAFPFGQISENIKEPDDNDGDSEAPDEPDTLSVQEATSLILLLKPGEGETL